MVTCIEWERAADSRGRLQRRRKVTMEQREAIKKDPRLHRLIAADYGIHRTHVGAIKAGKG